MATTASNSVVIRNIFYMLSYATGTSGNDAKSSLSSSLHDIDIEDFDGYLDVLAALLMNAIYAQRMRGFAKSYRQTSEDLSTVRGSISIRDTMLIRRRGSLQMSCSFDVLTENILMNQILKTTGLYLLRVDGVDGSVKKGLRTAIELFDGVETINPRSICWNRLRYNQLNQSYRYLMSICQMILESKIATEMSGQDARFPDIFSEQRLASLFEHFVLEYYRKHYPELHASAPYVDYGITIRPKELPSLHTDVVLFGSHGTLIIDTKCYGRILQAHCEKEILSPAHRNQILSYVLHMGTFANSVSGMLLYAQTELSGAVDIEWKELGYSFSARTLNLGVEFSSIAAQLDAIAESIS